MEDQYWTYSKGYVKVKEEVQDYGHAPVPN